MKKHISPNPKDPQKSFLNIPGMLSEIAVEQGIPKTQIHFDSSWDSMTNSNFFSARRSTPPEQREAESQKKYPKTARGITFVHGLFKKKTAIKPLESAYGSKLHSWRNFR